MQTSTNIPASHASHVRRLFVAAVLFFFYQLPQATGYLYLMLLFPFVAWWGSHALGFSGMRAWYLDTGSGALRLLALGLALAIAAKFAAVAIGTHTGVYSFAWADAVLGAGLAGTLALLAFLTFVPSIAEDILTRGLVLRAFPRLGQRWIFILVSAVLYVLNHVYRLHEGPVAWHDTDAARPGMRRGQDDAARRGAAGRLMPQRPPTCAPGGRK